MAKVRPRAKPKAAPKPAPRGILSAPPARRQAQKPQRKAQPKTRSRRERKKENQVYTGLNTPQRDIVQQREQQDIALGEVAGEQIPRVDQRFDTEFDWNALPQAGPQVDWNALPQAPVQGDFQTWRQEQIDATNADFERRTAPQFKQDEDDLRQYLANTGNGPGSPRYEKEMEKMRQSHSDARQTQLVNAMGIAGQNAGQFFDVGSRARQGAIGEGVTRFDMGNLGRSNALQEGLQQRYMPLNELNQLNAARSGMDMQNLGYAQGRNIQDDQQAHDRWMLQHQPRGGGGGGGGGAAPFMGFGSAQDMWAAQDARARAQQMWEWQNAPKSPRGPSNSSLMGGQILGTGLGLLGAYAGENWF